MGPVDGSVLWYSRRGFPGWIRFIYDKSFLADLFSVSNPTWRRGCESWGSMASAALQGEWPLPSREHARNALVAPSLTAASLFPRRCAELRRPGPEAVGLLPVLHFGTRKEVIRVSSLYL